jgi:hypothetical protein
MGLTQFKITTCQSNIPQVLDLFFSFAIGVNAKEDITLGNLGNTALKGNKSKHQYTSHNWPALGPWL